MIGLTHHELIVVLQQQRPLRRIQGGRDLLRLDGEVLGDLRWTAKRVRGQSMREFRGEVTKRGGGCVRVRYSLDGSVSKATARV